MSTIYYLSSKEMKARYLEVLPYETKRFATSMLKPKYTTASHALVTGELNHPDFDMRSFLKTESIFIHIPKAAGSSIGKQIYGGITCSHTSLYWYTLALTHKQINSFFIYSIVRNPWDRLHSAYYFLRSGGLHRGDRQSFREHLSHYTDFADFVHDIPKSGLPPIIHFKPMHYFVELRPGKTFLDYFGYFEDLDRAYARILDRIPRPEATSPRLCRENITTNKAISYKEDYTGRMIDIVGSTYSRDIDLFGYTFDGHSRESAKFQCRRVAQDS
ncbi:MAG: hypothetical protein A0129_15195 [Limnobacter sp. CACIAM 66H1]|uniref:sulfotransferase family 2 domain-containing protein n=1 Tax=Limnobacter sp. CACIAM 66H1 TaxID=1813033 RepID=UPI0007A8CBCB|nr:sulfotransferase family 2 domain-containing protein [Limnobacter sp. CACIAM 66H1]KYP10022.1 MAG: hypothetical protein A0129_15195 [Limnobacter sp. CACIAM 66H1]